MVGNLPLMQNGKPDSARDALLQILGEGSPMTAKKLFYELKGKYCLSITYQATHKTLKCLMDQSILIKKDQEYAINPEWVQELHKFSKDFKKRLCQDETTHKKAGKTIKVISFDLDGCLSDNAFDELVWRTEIPNVYAEEKNLSFDEAYKFVVSEYRRLWGQVDGWRDPQFWLEHFGLKTTSQDIIEKLKKDIKHYGDVVPVLSELNTDYKLIVVSHADRRFLDLKIKTNNLERFFASTFSTISDFKSMKKDGELFKKICEKMGVNPSEIIHVGDDYEFDYQIPTSIGIRSFLIDRTGNKNETYIIRDLFEFTERITELNN